MTYELSGQHTLKLTFVGEDFEGVEATVSLDVPMQEYWAYLSDRFDVDKRTNETVIRAFDWFGDRVLLGWNVTLEGKPVEATSLGFRQASPRLAAAIINKWAEVLLDPDIPLEQPSKNGSSSQAP